MDTVSSYGTGLHYGDDILANTPTYTEIDNVDKVTPPTTSVGVTELKPLKAPGRAVIKKANWRSAGDCSISMFFDKAQQAALYAMLGVEKAWKVTLADGSTCEFDGFLSGFGNPELNGDDEVMIDITLTASGLPAFTAAA